MNGLQLIDIEVYRDQGEALYFGRIDQLRVNANPPISVLDTAFHNGANIQLGTNFRNRKFGT